MRNIAGNMPLLGEIIAQTVHFRERRPLSSLLHMPRIWELKEQMVADMS